MFQPSVGFPGSDSGDVRQSRTPRTPLDADEAQVGKILCVFMNGNVVGAASYEMATGTFGVLDEVPDTPPNFAFVSHLVTQVEPTIVVLSRRVDIKLSRVIVAAMADMYPETSTTELTTSTTVFTTPTASTSRAQYGQASSFMAGGDCVAFTTGSSTSGPYGAMKAQRSSSQESTMSTQMETPGPNDKWKRSVPMAFVQKVRNCPNVVTIPPNIFALNEAKKIVLNMDRTVPANVSHVQHVSSLSGKVDLEQTVTIQALAGLLKYMEDQSINIIPSCIEPKEPKVVPIHIEDMLQVNENTKQALSIFRTVIKTTNQSKTPLKSEGFSLYKLIESQCPSSVGKRRLRHYLTKPSKSLETITYRLNCIEFFLDPASEPLVAMISKDSSHISSLDLILTRMRNYMPKPKDWAAFKRCIQSCLNIARHFIDNSHFKYPADFIGELNECKLDKLEDMLKKVVEQVDFEGCKTNDWFTINVGVDPDLDEARYRISQIEGLCAEAVAYEKHYWAQRGLNINCGVGFWPAIGFMMELRTTEDNFLLSVQTIAADGQCEVVKSTPAALFYRTPTTNHLNNTFQDPRTFINDREAELQLELQIMVTEHTELILKLLKFCADTQCFIAMSKAAKFNGWIRPLFNNAKRIEIKEGRHPLSELCVLRFFPNDYNNDTKVKVITGHNTSGKSIYMNQVGMIIYMAQVGCFVPATYANIHLVDKLLTCTRVDDSISTGMSFFQSTLNQVATIIREATNTSVILLDEFGKGTHPAHGAALLASLVNYFVSDPRRIPNLLLATHFHTALNFMKPDPTIDFLMFSADEVNGEYTNQYRLIRGKAKTSLAFDIAQSVGIPKEIVDRARDFTSRLKNRVPLVPLEFKEREAQEKIWMAVFENFMKVPIWSQVRLNEFIAFVERCMAEEKALEAEQQAAAAAAED